MTSMQSRNHNTMSGASAPCANASFSCAQTASAHFANSMINLLDAMILASIIICALLSLVLLGLVNLLVLVSLLAIILLVVVTCNFMTPMVRVRK